MAAEASALDTLLTRALGDRFWGRRLAAAAGGCISDSFVYGDGDRRFFVKRDGPGRLTMFEAEAEGLRELADARAIRVPGVVAVGEADGAVLVLEYIALSSPDESCLARLGDRLAALHEVTAKRHGWRRDNTIGGTPQRNDCDHLWPRFFAGRRIGPQLELAAAGGYRALADGPGRRLIEAIPALLDGHEPLPSLLHGDLWSGNLAADQAGAPVVYDPAVYFGDRETDIAMTELFGGLGQSFRAAYEAAWPLAAGYPVRRELYNLYHVLNHLNLFGAGYLARAEIMISRLLAETR